MEQLINDLDLHFIFHYKLFRS